MPRVISDSLTAGVVALRATLVLGVMAVVACGRGSVVSRTQSRTSVSIAPPEHRNSRDAEDARYAHQRCSDWSPVRRGWDTHIAAISSLLLPDHVSPAIDYFWPLEGSADEPRIALVATKLGETTGENTNRDICRRLREPNGHRYVGAVDASLREYALGWCAHWEGSPAHDRILRAASSRDAEVANAAMHDAVVVAARSLPAKESLSWLVANGLHPQTLDLLAAQYASLGRADDALAILDEAEFADPHPTETVACERAATKARMLFVIGHAEQAASVIEEWTLVSRGNNLSCGERAEAVRCQNALEALATDHVPSWPELRTWCLGLVSRGGVSQSTVRMQRLALAAAKIGWPAASARSSEWAAIAKLGERALPDAAAVEIILTALENMVNSSDCTERELDVISAGVKLLRNTGGLTLTHRQRLQRLPVRRAGGCSDQVTCLE